MQSETKNNIVFSELQFLVHKGWKTSLQVELRKLSLEQDKYTRCKRRPGRGRGAKARRGYLQIRTEAAKDFRKV